MRRCVLFVLCLALAGGVAAGATAHAQTYLATDEALVLELLNGTRAGLALKPLARNTDLVAMARGQAVRMAERGGIYHNPRLGQEADERGLDWQRLGENVGTGPEVETVEDAFLASPGHYHNIIYPDYTSAGIGVVRGSDGRVYVVQVFAQLATRSVEPVTAPATAVQPSGQVSAPADPSPEVAAAAQPKAAPEPPPAPTSPDPNALTGGVTTGTPIPGVGAV
jgi:hypothetical protein